MTNKELLKQAQELIEKGIISTSALATGGKLNPEQANRMIDFVFDETKLKGMVRLIRMRAEQYDIDKIGVGRRVARAKTEGVDPGVRRGVITSKVLLNKKAIMVPFELTTEFLEDAIETGSTLEDHVAGMMGKAFANDLENMYIAGDQLGPGVPESDLLDGGSADYVVDDLVAIMDGWVKVAGTGNILDADSAGISSNIFSRMKKALPTKFRRRLGQMRFFLPMDTAETYRNVLASRGTALGDQAIQNEVGVKAMGVSLEELALMDPQPLKVAHVTLTGTTPAQLNGDKNITSAVAHLQTLSTTPTAPIADPADIVFDLAAGTVERSGGSTLPTPVSVKVTYHAQTEILLTEGRNLLLGIGRDITIKRDEDIYKDVRQWAMTVRVAVNVEEVTACVLAKNIAVE
jgi:hypothetical protein